MGRFLAALGLLAAIGGAGCRCRWEGRNVWLADDAAAGRTLETRVRDELLLELPVDPGSKARWFVVEVDERVLSRKGPAEEQPGAGRVRIPFDARRVGVTDLVAFYADSRSAPPVRTYRTTVWVR